MAMTAGTAGGEPRAGSRDECDGGDDGKVLPAVRHEGELERGDIDEAEHRRKGYQVVAHHEEQGFPPCSSVSPQHGHDGNERQIGQEGYEGGVHVPARIDHAQIMRHQCLAEIEPDRPSGGGEPREESLGAHCLSLDHHVLLEPHRKEADRPRQGEERGDTDEIAPVDGAALPPGAYDKHCREDHHG
jgi:hypothetical protein